MTPPWTDYEETLPDDCDCPVCAETKVVMDFFISRLNAGADIGYIRVAMERASHATVEEVH